MPPLPDKILGHEKEQALLLQDIAKENVSHAYLFSGPAHIGKTTVAQWFAVELLGSAVPPEEKKNIAAQVARLIHPDALILDMLWIEDVTSDWAEIGKYSNAPQLHRSKGTPAKSDVIGIDDIRLIIDALHETGSSPYRVCIISNVERMNAEAANALLKMLEEPPRKVIFLLTTSDLGTLPPTLVSRARSLSFFKVPPTALRTLTAGLPDDEADLLLHLSRGAPGTLVRFLQQPELLRSAKQLHSRAKAFWQATTVTQRLALLLGSEASREAADALLLHLGLTLREHASLAERAAWTPHFTRLAEALETNANRGLALQSFTLALSTPAC